MFNDTNRSFTLCCRQSETARFASGAKKHLRLAFRPKTSSCYTMLFRIFVAFCVLLKLSLTHISVENILSYPGYLARNGVTAQMTENHRIE